jgi:hypothetical protein
VPPSELIEPSELELVEPESGPEFGSEELVVVSEPGPPSELELGGEPPPSELELDGEPPPPPPSIVVGGETEAVTDVLLTLPSSPLPEVPSLLPLDPDVSESEPLRPSWLRLACDALPPSPERSARGAAPSATGSAAAGRTCSTAR